MHTIYFEDIPIGPEHPPLLLPDIGTFFNQDIARAEQLVREVRSAGTRVIKGEILHNADICLDVPDTVAFYSQAKGSVQERYRSLIERKTVSLAEYEGLFGMCRRLGMPFVLSVYDIEGAQFARDIGACALKIASSNIVHAPLIRYVAALGLPVILDTGKNASLSEICRAVEWARAAGAADLVVEHSPPAPPAAVSRHNLRVLQSFREMFNCAVGLSDHHSGEEMLLAAAALGAQVLEKGVCPNDMQLDQDVSHALPVGRLGAVINKCRAIHEALGSTEKLISAEAPRSNARMGLIARQEVRPGLLVNLETVSFAFPTRGIPVEMWDLVESMEFNCELAAGTPIKWEHVQAVSA